MQQTLMGHGLAQLEHLLDCSKGDEEMLGQLEDELRYRRAPEARALLVKVQSTLHGAKGRPLAMVKVPVADPRP